MSTPSSLSTEQTQVLATFDTARDAFLAAFGQAPDAALPYVPAGEEYALAGLLMHLRDTTYHYLNAFEQARRADFGPVDLTVDVQQTEREARRHAELVAARPTGADREPLLTDLRAAHERVRQTAKTLDGETFTRQAPVIYSAGSQPYPTSCRDILGWLTDHYDEHTRQVQGMLAGWRAQSDS
jgi:uncharacterized damage-inducible protein DinB